MKLFPLSIMSFIFLMMFSLMSFSSSLYYIVNYLVYFIEWEVVSINSASIVMTMILDWMLLLFMSCYINLQTSNFM